VNIQHFDVIAGENRTLTLYARDSSNAVQNLTGLTVNWRVGRGPFDPDNDTPNFTAAGTTLSAASGSFTVPVTPDNTQNMEGVYQHQAYTTDAQGNLAVVCGGFFRVRPGIASA